jgi:dihydropteroate synthase
MKKYYTRVCNFYYGNNSQNLIKKKKALPLNGNLKISFDHVEIL